VWAIRRHKYDSRLEIVDSEFVQGYIPLTIAFAVLVLISENVKNREESGGYVQNSFGR